jgi:outer membrane usher protein
MLSLRPHLRRELVAALFWLLLAVAMAGAAEKPDFLPLQLDVSINGQRTGLIGSFTADAQGQLFVARKELQDLGVRVDPGNDDEMIAIDALPNVTYKYDPARQSVDLALPAERIKPHVIGPAPIEAIAPSGERMVAGVVNYSLTGSLYEDQGSGPAHAVSVWPNHTLAASLDTRLIGPFGTLATSGIVGDRLTIGDPLLRLDSTWSWSSPERLGTVRVGDVVTRGPSWTRPLRLGGAQVQTNFALRPDLVTAPLPTFMGTAAVPSSVDVFINNTKMYSQQVQPGPFVISNLPLANSSGTASIVVRDVTGRETVQSVQFYNSPVMLKAGLYDYSLEAGVARQNYGMTSFDYDERAVASASLRTGINDVLTLEGHAEAGSGLVNAGAGATMSVLGRSIVSLAGAASHHQGQSGLLGYAAFETGIGPLKLHLSTQRTLGDYQDLASIEPDRRDTPFLPTSSLSVPKALDIASASYSLAETGTSFNLNVVNRRGVDERSLLLNANVTQPLGTRAAFMLSGFHDLANDTTGIFAGLSIPLGDLGHAQFGVNRNVDGLGFTADYSKTAALEPGSYGWRVTTTQGHSSAEAASATYQGSVAKVEAGAAQAHGATEVRATADGSMVVTRSGVFLANRIDDAFAIVDVGAPGVAVAMDNRTVARTNADGVALVPGLRSYQRNRISIDPDVLPADAVVPETTSFVAPADHSGVSVSLRAESSSNAAVVELRRPDGSFVPAGSRGVLVQTGRPFVVGYDGRAFIESLAKVNEARIEIEEARCTATFPFEGHVDSQAYIPGVICR